MRYIHTGCCTYPQQYKWKGIYIGAWGTAGCMYVPSVSRDDAKSRRGAPTGTAPVAQTAMKRIVYALFPRIQADCIACGNALEKARTRLIQPDAVPA